MLQAEQLEALGMLVFQPSRYIQRVVEQLSFLPSGGERWQRDVQIRIPQPESESSHASLTGSCIVSLGMFRRCRFPDFTVEDSNGERLPLLTRRQHQHCITMATITQYLDDQGWGEASTKAANELRALYQHLASLITDIKGTTPMHPEQIGQDARELMVAMDREEEDVEQVSAMLQSDGEMLARYTHYLCWVPADWGDTVSLSATYTMSDSVRIAGAPRKTLAPHDEREEENWWTRNRTRLYTGLSLFPVLYELRAPAHDHAGSYYLTIEPPDDAHVSLLDWGNDRSFGGATSEIDCAFATCHIHNGEQLADTQPDDSPRQSIAGAKISAFLKADPVDHAALLAVAILNIGLAYLAQRGAFVPEGDENQQQWLLLAPTLVVALIAQHRRRYYSSVTKPVRIVLWGYLTINVLFGSSVAFDVFGGNELDDYASGGMAIVSLALIVLLIASGDLFDWTTRKLFSRSSVPDKEGAQRYMTTVRRYADATVVMIAIVAALALTSAVTKLDWGSERRDRVTSQNSAKGIRDRSKMVARPTTALDVVRHQAQAAGNTR